MNDWHERFDEKWMPEPMSGCWLWIGGGSRKGYGRFSKDGLFQQAHRVAYERWVGPVPPGLVLDHLCRQRCCVNPEHLEPVTDTENILRGRGWGAQNHRKTHCPRGHEYTPANTRLHGGRWRECRTCSALHWKKQSRELPRAATLQGDAEGERTGGETP